MEFRGVRCGSFGSLLLLLLLLESILSKEANQKHLPTLDNLIEHRFFAEYAPRFNEQYAALIASNRPHFNLSAAAKEQLKIATQKIEHRLQSEQKSVKHQKRLVRVQEMMTSEEKKKKSKHKAKLEHKQSNLRQQNSLQLGNNASGSVLLPVPRSDSAHSISTIQGGILSPPPNTTTTTTSTTNGASFTPLPPPPPPPPLPTIPQSSSTTMESITAAKEALLNSISNFNKSALRKVASSD